MKLSLQFFNFTHRLPAIFQSLKWSKLILSVTLFALVSACGEAEDKEPKQSSSTAVSKQEKTIIVGFGPSTYVDQFDESIKPLLEEQGYQVKKKVFSQNSQINPALKEGAIDASVFQSQAYMTEVNRLLEMSMVKLADTASAPQTLRSTKHSSLDEVKDGMLISMPNDPVNAERAAHILADLGWVKIPEGTDSATFNTSAIEPGDYQLKFKEMDSAQSLRTLNDVDFAIVNGNYVANAGEKISDGLVIENTPAEHVVIVTIREEDQDTDWANDLKAAYESKTFEEYIKSKPLYEGFILPAAWRE